MVCKNCGAEFSEGVFCPECGTKIVQEASDKEKENKVIDYELEMQKQKTEQERLAKEKTEKEAELAKIRLEQAKLEEERLKRKARLDAENKIKIEAERKEKEEEKQREAKLIEQKKIENEGKGMAILSLICGIVAVCSGGAFFIPEILGIVFSLLGKKQGKMRKMSIVGMILSVVSIGMLVAIIYLGLNVWSK